MIKNVLTDIGGIGVYGVISICLFVLVFGGTVIWAFLLERKELNQMSVLPLEDESSSKARAVQWDQGRKSSELHGLNGNAEPGMRTRRGDL